MTVRFEFPLENVLVDWFRIMESEKPACYPTNNVDEPKVAKRLIIQEIPLTIGIPVTYTLVVADARQRYATHVKIVNQFPGGFSEAAPPVPIPNTAVKRFSADDTASARAWENRSPPGAFFFHEYRGKWATPELVYWPRLNIT